MVRTRSYTEAEQIAILHAVLVNKDVLEEVPAANWRSHSEAWKTKWDEVAATIDAYFGTNRGSSKIRSLYNQWKYSAKKKYKSTKITTATELDYESKLSMADRLLRQICPDIFPKVIAVPVTSTNGGSSRNNDEAPSEGANGVSNKSNNEVIDEDSDKGTDEVTDGDEDEELQLPANPKNGNEDSSVSTIQKLEESDAMVDAAKVAEDAKKLINQAESSDGEKTDFNPNLRERANSDLDTLVLSLQSMIDIESGNEPPTGSDNIAALENYIDQKMETNDVIGEIENAIEEYETKIVGDDRWPVDSKSEEAGSSFVGDKANSKTKRPNEPLDLSKEEVAAQNTAVDDQQGSKTVGAMKKGVELDSTIDNDGPSDVKKIDEEKMEIEMNERATVEKPKNSTEPPTAPDAIFEKNQNPLLHSEDANVPFPELPISDITGKRKKPQNRERNVKKRKVTRSSSTKV